MQIENVEPEPFASVPYRSAASPGRSVDRVLPLVRARVDTLPEGLDAILVASDLQGRCGSTLLGEHLATEVLALVSARALPSADRIGVVFAGDLYAAPRANVRGASGDVTAVWEAFASDFRWVVGVAGNHDTLDERRLASLQRVDVLDGDTTVRDGLVIAGLGGIVGNPARPRRRSETAYLEGLGRLVRERPDLLVLHESPIGGAGQRGRPEVNERVDGHVPVVVSGHVHWRDPLALLPRGTRALNVDGRVVVLTRAT